MSPLISILGLPTGDPRVAQQRGSLTVLTALSLRQPGCDCRLLPIAAAPQKCNIKQVNATLPGPLGIPYEAAPPTVAYAQETVIT